MPLDFEVASEATEEDKLLFVGAVTLQNIINKLVKNGRPVTALPADNPREGRRGFIVFSEDEDGKEITFNHEVPFRPPVKETIRCETREEYDGYREAALEKKWLVVGLDDPIKLLLGFTVQNSDGVILYTIHLSDWKVSPVS